MSKKKALFKRGIEAAHAVFDFTGIYICPICAKGYDSVALARGRLTLEHVPPRSVGGKGIILTCADCNNTAGHTVDAAIAGRTDQKQFMDVLIKKKDGAAGRAVLQINDTPINVEVHRENEMTTFHVLSGSNDPAAVKSVKRHWETLATQGKLDGEQFKVTTKASYQERLACVGDLRCAFLVCTAIFGYRFAFSPALDPVRAQIASPTEEILPRWWINADMDIPFKKIGVSEQTGVVVVRYNNQCVVLPSPLRVDGCYQKFAERIANGETITFKFIPWPTFFHARLDLGVTEVK